MRILVLLSIFPALVAQGADNCNVSQDQFQDPDDVARYVQSLTAKIEGELGKCESILGIYQRTEAGRPNETLRISKFQPSQLILLKGAKSYEAVFKVETLKENGAKASDGVAVLDDGQWKILRVTDPNKLSIRTVYPEGATFGAFEKFKATGMAPSGTEVEAFDFSKDRTVGKSASSTLQFDDTATVKNRTEDPSAFRMAGLLAPNEEVRIHRDMYSLLGSKEFKDAKKNDDNTKMVDLIWARALEVAKGNKTDALYLALLTTDLRTRGPCGSFYARRGRELVPNTIFDGEKPSILKENRLDALQHFFGYALVQNNEGQKVAEVLSKISKDKDYYSPRFTNFTRSFHSTREPGETITRSGLMRDTLGVDLTPPYWEAERTGYDIEVDKLYNKLGIEFGRRLAKNADAKPSLVINDKRFESDRKKLGLASAASRDWIAIDPKLEIPVITWKAPEQRNRELSSLDYTGAAKCKQDAGSSECESGLKAAAAVCGNAGSANDSKLACSAYRQGMGAVMDRLNTQRKSEKRLEAKRSF